MLPQRYNRLVTIRRRADGVAADSGFGNAGEFSVLLTGIPCNIEQEAGNKAEIYGGDRFTALGVAMFEPQHDIRVGDRIGDGSRVYEITKSHLVYASINIPTARHCEWREVQQ